LAKYGILSKRMKACEIQYWTLSSSMAIPNSSCDAVNCESDMLETDDLL
jgi:hypothetical protein